MINNFTIKNVFRKRGFVRVVFDNNYERIIVDFADKYGQYKLFATEKNKGKTYSKEWIENYSKWIKDYIALKR